MLRSVSPEVRFFWWAGVRLKERAEEGQVAKEALRQLPLVKSYLQSKENAGISQLFPLGANSSLAQGPSLLLALHRRLQNPPQVVPRSGIYARPHPCPFLSPPPCDFPPQLY